MKGHASAPIGVFDSGVGGLSVLQNVRAELPHEDLLYYADQANCPYGERSPAEIETFTLAAVRWLKARGCKLVVIACNTACAFSLAAVRRTLEREGDDPSCIVGLVPALKPAVLHTASRVVGVFATPVTLQGSLLQEVIEKHAAPAGVQVHKVFHPSLVPMVEAGAANSPEARAVLREVLTPLAQAGADSLVLGCTHYPFLEASIRAEFGETFALYDSGAGVARRVRSLLEASDLLNPGTDAGTLRLFTTGQAGVVQDVVQQLLGSAAPVEPLSTRSAFASLPGAEVHT
ncbi:glutamate racemase [Deinococcus ruber]|uniref:Glutamate racemase n=1 Tax=Deinococcus ruber TaxID=1848197 RepID=A0A918BVI1_9DEIO|nr:glutamate racemase [Deinococcus ruber]GGQ92797.1 glutamate racemase [Deinococcus ruber]